MTGEKRKPAKRAAARKTAGKEAAPTTKGVSAAKAEGSVVNSKFFAQAKRKAERLIKDPEAAEDRR